MFLLAAPLLRALGTAEEPPADDTHEPGDPRNTPPRRSVLSGARWPRRSCWSSSGALYELEWLPRTGVDQPRGEHEAIRAKRPVTFDPERPIPDDSPGTSSHDRSSDLQVTNGARGATPRIRCRVRWRGSACRLTTRSLLGVEQRMPPAAVATVVGSPATPRGLGRRRRLSPPRIGYRRLRDADPGYPDDRARRSRGRRPAAHPLAALCSKEPLGREPLQAGGSTQWRTESLEFRGAAPCP